MLSKSSYVSVKLLEDRIYIDPKSDLNNAIRGTINIQPNRTINIKSIYLTFNGVMETKKGAKVIARQKLVVYQDANNQLLILNSGLTKFDFEMQLPSKLLETINCQDIKINYFIEGKIEYYTSYNLIKTLIVDECKYSIHVIRLPNDILLDNNSYHSNGNLLKYNWLHYQVLIHKKAVVLGSKLPITLRVIPQQEDLVIENITIQLLEKRYIQNEIINNSIETISTSKKVWPINLSSIKEFESTIEYTIPENLKSIVHSTQESADFNIQHIMLFSMSVKHGNKKKLLSFQSNIDLLSSSIGELDNYKLPSYDSPPPFDDELPTTAIFPEYDRKFIDPPSYSEIFD